MPLGTPSTATLSAATEVGRDHRGLPQLWGRRGYWQIRLRWGVAPLMVAGLFFGRAFGFELPVLPILLIAVANALYNLLFACVFSHYEERLKREPQLDRFFTILEVLADYAAMFLLLHYTGGVASPLVFFLVFHVIIAAIQFSSGTAYQLAGLAAGGLWLLLLGQVTDRLACHALTFRGMPVSWGEPPAYAAGVVLIFTATLFLTAAIVGRIMQALRGRVRDLSTVSTELRTLNGELQSLYSMVRTIGAQRRLEPILATVTSELAQVTQVPAVAVKLLDDERRTLRYVAVHGLPEEFIAEQTIPLAESPLNQRIIEGETLVEGRITEDDTLLLRSELGSLGIQSAVLAPLSVEERVIGTLGFYSHAPDRFENVDTEFVQLAAELVAIAIENARGYEAIEDLMRERTEFMLEVAHNMRAPLGAGLSMLELLVDGSLGEVTSQQKEYLQRIDRRLRALHQTIGELLTIARARDWTREIPDVVVDLRQLAERTEKTFRGEADRKGLRFRLEIEDGLPAVDSGADLLEKVLENLVSNAIKYTPEGGEVEVRFASRGPEAVRITVRDTGIGIPAKEQGNLFKEFFRASNAKEVTAVGTGLGLALVKQTVERHHGQLHLASEEGKGTTVEVDLPARRRFPTAP